MAKFELKFLDFFGQHFIKVEKKIIELHTKNKDVIQITIASHNGLELFINLDKSTAIKFAKTLRTEINKIAESEVSNG
jgi:hypothetical protein